jgi:hypothetical protein
VVEYDGAWWLSTCPVLSVLSVLSVVSVLSYVSVLSRRVLFFSVLVLVLCVCVCKFLVKNCPAACGLAGHGGRAASHSGAQRKGTRKIYTNGAAATPRVGRTGQVQAAEGPAEAAEESAGATGARAPSERRVWGGVDDSHRTHSSDVCVWLMCVPGCFGHACECSCRMYVLLSR